MISFYPGPSRVYDAIKQYVADAHREGVLSMNHRSPACTHLVQQTVRELKRKLKLPADYTVLFTSSATECWEIIAQSLIETRSTHLGNGAFAQKWFTYTQALHPQAEYVAFDLEEPLPVHTHVKTDVICITQNETSNGTQVDVALIKKIKQQHDGPLIAVDATSSLGGIRLDFTSADLWFASVQKCFGLPAGLGLLICSPRALQRAHQLNKRAHYNSLVNQMRMMELFQTTHTPNVLGIYLLYRSLKDSPGITTTDKRIRMQAKDWYAFLQQHKILTALVKNNRLQSQTVITVTVSPTQITNVKKQATKAGFILGEGYGPWKETTFRIANFPALKPGELKKLQRFLKSYPQK
ncbi:MAG: alanine--glyoxylate aminotransferase family protein [Cytophagales bacterium]|nr:alanine--glyoxylate aminotransferase family protein [Cytophagales bacterium]